MNKNYNQISFFFILIISTVSFYFGYLYSIVNTDFHHWTISIEPYIDYKNGYKLFEEIFIIYGIANIFLYDFFSYFFEINLFTIGLINQFFFSLKFIFFYFILNFFFKNYISLLGTFVYFIFYSFSEQTSTDGIASFFLHLFAFTYLYNFKKESTNLIFISAFFLFMSVSFRHVYLITFLGFSCFIFFIQFFSRNFLYEKKIILNFLFILFCFNFYLYYIGSLKYFYFQSFGVGYKTFLTLDASVSNIEDFFLIFKKILFLIARVFKYLLIPNSYGSSSFFTLVFVINIIYLTKIFIDKKLFSNENRITLVFFSLSFFGLIQTLHTYETQRLMNSSFLFLPIFFSFFFKLFKKNKKIKIYLTTLFLVFLYPIVVEFPFYNNYFQFKIKSIKNFDNNYFHSYFANKKLEPEYLQFYQNIKKDICRYDYIYNFSFDRILHLLCNNRKIYMPTLYFHKMNNNFTLKQILNLNNKKILIVDHLEHKNLNLIREFQVPKFYRYTHSDTLLKFFPDKIYIYSLSN